MSEKKISTIKNLKFLLIWFGAVSIILVIAGTVFAFWGFGFFPSSILPRQSLLNWESSIYGALMIGWGTTLFLLGRLAFKRNDIELMKIMFYGLAVWLIIEAIFSAYLRVYFNVGVDAAVLLLFGIPLVLSIRHLKKVEKSRTI
jgi:hypothetical protein